MFDISVTRDNPGIEYVNPSFPIETSDEDLIVAVCIIRLTAHSTLALSV